MSPARCDIACCLQQALEYEYKDACTVAGLCPQHIVSLAWHVRVTICAKMCAGGKHVFRTRGTTAAALVRPSNMALQETCLGAASDTSCVAPHAGTYIRQRAARAAPPMSNHAYHIVDNRKYTDIEIKNSENRDNLCKPAARLFLAHDMRTCLACFFNKAGVL